MIAAVVHTFLGVTSTEAGQAGLGLLVLVIGAVIRHKLEKVSVKVTGVEVMVNGRFNAALARIDQLEAAIRANGHHVPAGSLTVDEPLSPSA